MENWSTAAIWSAAPERESQSRANFKHSPGTQTDHPPAQSVLRNGDSVVQIDGTGPFIPSEIPRMTSEGTSRMVEEIGATVTVERCPTALSLVKIRTGRCLFGEANPQRCTSPRLSVPAMLLHPPKL